MPALRKLLKWRIQRAAQRAFAFTAWLACGPCALAQDVGVRPLPELYLLSSPDAMTQRVLSSQAADKHSGVVSAVLVSPDRSDPARARVSYQGAGTPVHGLSLPLQAVPSAPRGAESPKDRKAPTVLRRSLGAQQLLQVIKELERSRTLGPAKAWDAALAHSPESPPKKRAN